jgi:integrase
MGSVRTRKDNGLLFFDFRYEGERCREQTLLPDTAPNRKRMERALQKIEAEIASGSFDYAATFPGSKRTARPAAAVTPMTAPVAISLGGVDISEQSASPTFCEFTAAWLSEHQIEWRRSHIKVLNSTIDGHLLPEFGSKPVASITKADILAFRTKLGALPGRGTNRLSNKRINGILAVMRQILNEAADRHGFVSPCATLKPLKVRKTDVEPFSLTEVQQIIGTSRADYKDYFTVRFLTGMRTGEVHGLKWKYVDFANRLILIRETFVLGEDEYTKTDSSQREIQMSQPVLEALQRQHAATSKLSEYVFCNRQGQPLDNKNFSDRVWYPLLRHLGLKSRRPYQMRHTAATLWLASGEAPEWVARQLGHANTQMLFQVYSRYVPNLTRQDGSAIDRLLATRFASGQLSTANATSAASATVTPAMGARPSAANDANHGAQPPPQRIAA